jgi:hypothetical protein
VVTPSDVLSAVTGQLLESSDEATNVVKREDGSWLVDGRVRVLDAERAVGAYEWSGKNYTTVAGLVLARLGHIPTVPGETVAVDPDIEAWIKGLFDRVLPSARAGNCMDEYRQVAKAFRKTIAPHLNHELMSRALRTDWLLPEDLQR